MKTMCIAFFNVKGVIHKELTSRTDRQRCSLCERSGKIMEESRPCEEIQYRYLATDVVTASGSNILKPAGPNQWRK